MILIGNEDEEEDDCNLVIQSILTVNKNKITKLNRV